MQVHGDVRVMQVENRHVVGNGAGDFPGERQVGGDNGFEFAVYLTDGVADDQIQQFFFAATAAAISSRVVARYPFSLNSRAAVTTMSRSREADSFFALAMAVHAST